MVVMDDLRFGGAGYPATSIYDASKWRRGFLVEGNGKAGQLPKLHFQCGEQKTESLARKWLLMVKNST